MLASPLEGVSALNNAMSEQPATGQAAGVWIVFRFQHESRSFVASEIRGAWSGPALSSLSFRMGEERGLVGWIGARAQPLWLPNLKEETRWSGLDDALHSAYLTPIARQEETLG